jgi:DGQHR domain-containing protein
MKSNMTKSKPRSRKRKVLTPEQKQARKEKQQKMREQNAQKKEIRKIFTNLGYERLVGITGHNFIYDDRTSELDDVFVCENVVLIVEYTTDKNPGDHLIKKDEFYQRVNKNNKRFIQFMIDSFPSDAFKTYYYDKIKPQYQTLDLLQLKILYCSRYDLGEEPRNVVKNVIYFDYNIVQYFKLLTKVIKKSARYEFLDFLDIDYHNYGVNILNSASASKDEYKGYVLPEAKSSFKEGYKILSFYIDAESLMRRAYVLRRESWRNEENIRLYQRMLENDKIVNMRKYLYEESRVFVNNIIATISIDDIELKRTVACDKTERISICENGDFVNGNLTRVDNIQIEIKDKSNIIGIIDGQHRVFSYHEGNDSYEDKIKELRKVQNLLVTCIIYPKNISEQEKNRFEANLFLEINKNQKKISSLLQQEIELIVSPFSTISIGKDILKQLNENGPLRDKLIHSSYDKNKITTASIVSYGLRPLIKLDENAKDSLFKLWNEPNKLKLKDKNCTDDDLRNAYVVFCVEKIRDLLIAFKQHLSSNNMWEPYSTKNKQGVLGVVLLNGIMNVLRLLIENDQISTVEEYVKLLIGVEKFQFRDYKSSQYRRMGEKLYSDFFNKRT